MFNIPEFEKIVHRFHDKMLPCGAISKLTTSTEDWTLTDQVAHLIDSASNNHQRFIRLQLENTLDFPGYDAETWRRASKVGNIDYQILVDFWYKFNGYLLEIIRNVDPAALGHCWLADDEKKTLEFLINDYYAHLLWHEELFDRTVRDLTSSNYTPRSGAE
jgi:hypothetical protein